MLEEHSRWIGLVGPHNLLLFGSDILTREIATARTSTNPQSCSFNLFEPPDDKIRLVSSLRMLLVVASNLSDSNSSLMVSFSKVNLTWFPNFGFTVSTFKVGSV